MKKKPFLSILGIKILAPSWFIFLSFTTILAGKAQHLVDSHSEKNIIKAEVLMDDKHLWKGYVKKAAVSINEEDNGEGRDYKALLKDHCTPSFMSLDMPFCGNNSCAKGISFDGTVVVGFVRNGSVNWSQSFRWTRNDGMRPKPWLYIDDSGRITLFKGLTYVQGISLDSLVIIGEAKDGATSPYFKAFKWTGKTGMKFIPSPKNVKESYACGINFDGSAIIGRAKIDDNPHHFVAVRWTSEGMEFLDNFNERESFAQGMNFDGSIIVGSVVDINAEHGIRAYMWTREEGMKPLDALGKECSCAQAVNLDGSVIVGSAQDDVSRDQFIAFRWSAIEGMKSLGTLKGTKNSIAQAVNFDGSVIVGSAYNRLDGRKDREEAFRWTRKEGMKSVKYLLERLHKQLLTKKKTPPPPPVKTTFYNYAASLGTHLKSLFWETAEKDLLPPDWGEWYLTNVTAITPSGTVLIGDGRHNGRYCAWRAVIPKGNLF